LELANSSGSSLPIQRSLLWTQLVRKEYSQVLSGCERLADVLAKQGAKPATADARETAHFLGTVMAFLTGPASQPNLERALTDTKKRVLESLSPELASGYEEGYAAGNKTFAALQEELLKAKQEAERIQSEAKQTQSEQLAEQKGAIDKNKQSLDEKASKREQDTKDQAAELKAKVAELQQQYTNLMLQATPLQTQIVSAQAEIRGLTQTVRNEDGSVDTVVTDPRRVQFLEGVISRSQIQLVPLQSQIAAINVRANDLQNKYGSLMQQYKIDLNKLLGEEKQLAKSQTKLERIEKLQARNAASGSNAKTRLLAVRVGMFSSYCHSR
jgi:chromosome segregation ATPase